MGTINKIAAFKVKCCYFSPAKYHNKVMANHCETFSHAQTHTHKHAHMHSQQDADASYTFTVSRIVIGGGVVGVVVAAFAIAISGCLFFFLIHRSFFASAQFLLPLFPRTALHTAYLQIFARLLTPTLPHLPCSNEQCGCAQYSFICRFRK